jgi:hypothetical protein
MVVMVDTADHTITRKLFNFFIEIEEIIF